MVAASYQVCGTPRDLEPGTYCGPRLGPWCLAPHPSNGIQIGRNAWGRGQDQLRIPHSAHCILFEVLPHQLGTPSTDPGQTGNLLWLAVLAQTGDLLECNFLFVPIQIMDSCLKALCTTSAGVTHQLPTTKPQSLHQGSTQTWLPKLQRFFSHNWNNANYVRSKAPKSNDVEVPTALWHQWILLLPPWAKSLLTFFLADPNASFTVSSKTMINPVAVRLYSRTAEVDEEGKERKGEGGRKQKQKREFQLQLTRAH
jgi:hypothetical protein